MLLTMRKIEGKKQQTYSCGEDKKEKQHKLHAYEFMKCVYFGLKHKHFETQTFLE